VRTFSGAGRLRLLLDLLPEADDVRLAEKLMEKARDQPRKTVAGLIRQLLPDRLAAVVAGMIAEDSRKRAAEAGKEVWRNISQAW